jgi:hypothetical protein
MTRLLACGFAVAMLAGPASACLNDKELRGHEREFRSNYNGHPTPPPEIPPAPSDYAPIYGGGVALLVASAGLVVIRGRAKAEA